MKISELPDSKSKLLGTRLAGMKNLARHADFPELLVKRAYTIKAAVQFGGVLIECGSKGLYFFACQDPQTLLDTDLLYANGARIELNPNSIKFVRSDGLTYYGCAPRGSDKSDIDPRPIVQNDVTGWSAVITPCAGYGHAIKEQMQRQQYDLRAFPGASLSLGAFTEGSGTPPTWGTSGTQITPLVGSALVLWRDVPLRKTLGEIAKREGFYDDLVGHYPSQIREEAKKVAASKLSPNAAVPMCMAVSYCRGMGSADAYVGFGLTNMFAFQTAGSRSVAANLYMTQPTYEKSDFPEPAQTWSNISGSAFDCGFRSISPNGTQQWNLLTQPRPEFGWKLADGVPAKVFFENVQFEMRGFLKDFLPHSTTAQVDGMITPSSILGKDLPALSVGKDTDASARDKSMDVIVTGESACSEDYLVHARNVLAKTEAELGGGDTKHRFSGRIWPSSVAEAAARKTESSYTLIFPGSVWTAGASKIGGSVKFALGGVVTVKVRGVMYAGAQYMVVDVYSDGVFSRSYAEAILGATIGQSDTSLIRETITFDGVVYGAAATATVKAGPGALLREQAGKVTLSAVIDAK